MDYVQYQIDRLNAYSKSKVCNLKTPTTYYSQRDNYTMPSRTCNSSANAMYLDWLMRACGGSPLGGDDKYLAKVLSIGDTIYHHNQTEAIKSYGYSTKWNESKTGLEQRQNLVRLQDLISEGIPVVVNISHRGTLKAPRGGHIILLCGYLDDSEEWLCQDPYGTLRSDYQDINGRLSRIRRSEFASRWQGGFRVLT